MAEYIEREALVAELAKGTIISDDLYGMGIMAGMDFAMKKAVEIPAADVAPVRHGRWDDSGRYQFPNGAKAIRCSICGCALNESEYRLFNWNYCPVCGAKMDLEGGNSDE